MHKFFNGCLVLAVLVAAFFLYRLEHETRGLERQVARHKAKIQEEREAFKFLNAEWASLVRPERLQRLSNEYLKLSTINAQQQIKISDILQHVPAEPLSVLEKPDQDPIGAIVQEMQQ